MKRNLLTMLSLMVGIVANPTTAAYVDFTDSSTLSALVGTTGGFQGSVDGIGYTLTSADGTVNFNESYDGAASSAGCQANGGPLACHSDGIGIGNDEISGLSSVSGQVLTLQFDSEVFISSLDFLDLYLNPHPNRGGEQVRVSIDGNPAYLVDATGSSGDGGYANLDLLLTFGGPIIGQTLAFTAYQGFLLQDDGDNDYAFAGIEVSAVPLPGSVWLFGSALLGMVMIRRRQKQA